MTPLESIHRNANCSNTTIKLPYQGGYHIDYITDLTGDTFEIPVLFYSSIARKDFLPRKYINYISYTPERRSYLLKYKTAAPLLSGLLCDCSNHLCKGSCNNIVYYGRQGGIFDADLNPLILVYLKFTREAEDTIRFIKPIIKLNPLIFTKDDAVSKYLGNSFIKKLCTERALFALNIAIPSNVVIDHSTVTDTCDVSIEDLSLNVVKPEDVFLNSDFTYTGENINSLLNEFLVQHENLLLDTF